MRFARGHHTHRGSGCVALGMAVVMCPIRIAPSPGEASAEAVPGGGGPLFRPIRRGAIRAPVTSAARYNQATRARRKREGAHDCGGGGCIFQRIGGPRWASLRECVVFFVRAGGSHVLCHLVKDLQVSFLLRRQLPHHCSPVRRLSVRLGYIFLSSFACLMVLSMCAESFAQVEATEVQSAGTSPGGRFRTAPIIAIVYPGNTPANHPPTEACMIHSKQHRGCRIQGPGTRGKHQTKIKNPWCTSRGCGVQNSGPWDPWLPVVKNSRLFAQRRHSARCAPLSEIGLFLWYRCRSLLFHYAQRGSGVCGVVHGGVL